jgi:4'-phosphopantetheinyl transferase
MDGLRFPRRYFTLAAAPDECAGERPMSTPSPSSTKPAMPHWHWQPWPGDARARPDGAWMAAHGWLASLPEAPPDALPLHRDAHGRPRFAAATGAATADADAGWSHSGDGLLIAFGRGVVLGVDMEFERPRPKALEIARRHFAPAETEWLESQSADPADPVDPAARPQAGDDPSRCAAGALAPRDIAFLRLWCAKEAVLKAHGRGLAFGLDRLAFAERGGALVLVHADAALGDPAAWSLHEFVPHPGYRAALAWR